MGRSQTGLIPCHLSAPRAPRSVCAPGRAGRDTFLCGKRQALSTNVNRSTDAGPWQLDSGQGHFSEARRSSGGGEGLRMALGGVQGPQRAILLGSLLWGWRPPRLTQSSVPWVTFPAAPTWVPHPHRGRDRNTGSREPEKVEERHGVCSSRGPCSKPLSSGIPSTPPHCF